MPGTENSIRNTIDPSNNAGVSDADPPCSRKSGCNFTVSLLFRGSSVCVVLHLLDSASRESCSTVASTVERNPRISGPAQFRPMLFKRQLYRVR